MAYRRVSLVEKIFQKLQDEAGGPLNDLYILGGGKMQVDFEKKKINLFDQSEVRTAVTRISSRRHVSSRGLRSCRSSQIENDPSREVS